MTEEGKTSNSISVVHSILNRLKFSERHQGSSHVTDQHCRHSKNTNQCDSVILPESKIPEWNFTESNPSKCSVKPEGQNGADVDSEYFKERTVFQESRTTSTTFFKSEPQSNLLHNIRDAWQDLQPSESNSSWEEVKEDQISQAESHFSILKNSPPHGPFTPDPTDSEPRFVKGTAVPMEITKQPCRGESTVSH